MIPQSKNSGSWAFALADDRRGRRGLFQDADMSVMTHWSLGHSAWGQERNAGAP